MQLSAYRLLAFFALSTPIFAQFTFTSLQPQRPAGSSGFTGFMTFTGAAGGNAFGYQTNSNFALAPLLFNPATNQRIDLPFTGNSAAVLGGNDGTYAGYTVNNGVAGFPLAAGATSQSLCTVWTLGPAGLSAAFQRPVPFSDAWCVSSENSTSFGTGYQKTVMQVQTTNDTGFQTTTILQNAFLGNVLLGPSACCTRARGMRNGEEVGEYANFGSGVTFGTNTPAGAGSATDTSPSANPFSHAMVWHGTAASALDLHFAGAEASAALATNGSQQGGYYSLQGTDSHAAMWSGSAGSIVFLEPAGYSDTRVSGMATDFQVGDGWVGGSANTPEATRHGLLWRGDAGSVIDLNQYLPAGYPHMTITGADADGNISGYMQQDFNGTPAFGTDVGFILTPVASQTISSLVVSPLTPAPGDTVAGTVTLAAPAAAGGIFVKLTSSNGALVPAPADVMIPEGQTSASFSVVASATQFLSGPLPVTLTAHTGFATKAATFTVTPAVPADAIVSLVLSPAAAAPGDTVTGTVTLASPAPVAGAIVTFQSLTPSLLTAPPSVIVPAGSASASFAVSIPNVPFSGIVAAQGVLQAATGSAIQQASISVAPPVVLTSLFVRNNNNVDVPLTGGNIGFLTILVNFPPQSAMTVTLTSTNPAIVLPPTVTIAAGIAAGSATITALPVPVLTTGTVTATANGTSVSSNVSVAPVPQPALRSVAVPGVSSGQTFTGTVILTAPALLGGAVITLTSDTPGVASVPVSITVPFGATSATFSGVAGSVAGPVAVAITAGFNGASVIGSLQVIPGVLSITSVTLSPYSIVAPGTSITASVALNHAAPAGGVIVVLSASPALVKIPATLTIAAGQTSGSFSVQGNSVGSSSNVTLTASYTGVLAPSGTAATATLAVAPTDGLKVKTATWSKSSQILSVTATSTNAQSVIQVLNASGNVPIGTMTSVGGGSFSFQANVGSIASVNLKSNLGGSTGQGITVIP